MKIQYVTSIYILLFIGILIDSGKSQSTTDFDRLRQRMVKQDIELRGVNNPSVLNALLTVERHRFVPPELLDVAYSDRPLPIGHGQTISQPFIVAYMTELLQVDSTHKVLEIGTGSGYQAAVLAELAKEVYTIEIVAPLGQQAEDRLKSLGYSNVHVKIGDGYLGWPEHAPFDRIIVTAAPETVPPILVEQLKRGGRMVVPAGPRFWGQDLLIVEKDANGKITRESTIPVRFVPMIHKDSNNTTDD